MTRTAFLFPGQGSQSVGMMSALADDFKLVRDTFHEASTVLGYDLWSAVNDGPEDALNKTELTQPAMLVSGVATWNVWQQLGGERPDYFAGHGLGEYTALVAVGVIGFKDAISIVSERGRIMQRATPVETGAVTAVLGLEDKLMREICDRVENRGVVSCANYNAPGHVVISGNKEAVAQAGDLAEQAGALSVLPLPISVPSHCSLMKSAAAELRAVLLAAHFSDSSEPVIQNADVRAYNDAEQVREALARQLWQPIRWTETIKFMLDSGVNRFIECGPGEVLAGLNRQISEESTVFALTGQDDIIKALQPEEGNE